MRPARAGLFFVSLIEYVSAISECPDCLGHASRTSELTKRGLSAPIYPEEIVDDALEKI